MARTWWRWRQSPPVVSPQPMTLRYHADTAQTRATENTLPNKTDWNNQPPVYKTYPLATRVSLPPQNVCVLPSTLSTLAAWTQPGNSQQSSIPWNVDTLAKLCFYAYGLTGQETATSGATLDLRAAPSAGALYPSELYVALRHMDDAKNGVYHYAPQAHALETLRSADWIPWLAEASGDFAAVAEADAVFLISSLWWRTAWKYGPRAYRYCLQDAGHLAGNVAFVASALGSQATVVFLFADDPVNRLLGLDANIEAVQVLVAVRGNVPYRPPTRGSLVEPAPLTLQATPVSSLEFFREVAASTALPNALAARHARENALAPRMPHSISAQIQLPAPDFASPVSLCDSLLHRRSVREFGGAAISATALANVLKAAGTNPLVDLPPAQLDALQPFVLINRVDGIPAGAYRYEPISHALQLIQAGDLSAWTAHLSFDQRFCGDAGAAIFLLTDFDALPKNWADRAYRVFHLAAGLRGQAVYLASHALNLGCTGVGAYFDLETIRFLNVPASFGVIYELVIGSQS